MYNIETDKKNFQKIIIDAEDDIFFNFIGNFSNRQK